MNGHCSQCHGMNAASGGVTPDLRRLSADTHDHFKAIVMGARLSKGMPSYAEVLDPAQIDKIHAYLIKRANDLLDEEYSDDQ